MSGTGLTLHTVNVHTPEGTELLASATADEQTQYFTDGLGSVRVAQGTAGNSGFSYDAFGIELDASEGMPTNGAQADAVSHRYTGEYSDSQTGLIYLRARDYDPRIGRFISMDEHPGMQKIPLTLNKYLYANADPVNNTDPSGNMSLGELGAGLNIQGILSSIANVARMQAYDMISDALLSPIVDAVVGSFMKNGNVMNVSYGNAGFSQILTVLSYQCLMTKKCLFKKVPVLVNGWSSPFTSLHIQDALEGSGSTIGDTPYPLSFVLIKNSKRAAVKTSIFKKSAQCGRRPAGYDCDEYPYASTFNGGTLMYTLGGVSLRAVPSSDNRAQGGKLGDFYRKNSVTVGKPFINLAMPYGPTFYINKRGKVGF